ncbi:MAG TPA: O-antigen ligase family protein [Sphingomicrobium sp.]|jgi:O-antigen ligase|nr:O-antigen ligase family protein [Sphingomicrobium sp.]
MVSRARALVAPAYLFACLILGGSAQGIWQNTLLQLLGVAIIAWAALDKSEQRLPVAAVQLLLITIAAIAVVGLQMIPLPASIWTHLGPRAAVASGFQALGIPVPSEPLSLTPAAGLNALLGIIPPLAIVTSMVSLRAYRPHWLALALVAGTFAGIALGALQVASSATGLSSWYLYSETNEGRAVGFFANADHMATLLVVTIPFLAAIVASGKSANMQRYSATVAVVAGIAIVVVVGLGLNGSLAGYGLALPVIAASALILLPPKSPLRLWIVGLAVLLVLGCVAALETTSIGSGKLGEHASSATHSRTEILATTSRAIRDFMPLGSGLGSFPRVYPLYEPAAQVTSEYVVHAHNDYAEVALELGLAGIVIMLLFLAWWAGAVWRTWRSAQTGPFARAAAIASAAVLVHSIVDFPLRTAAISACLGMCLALLADSRAAPPKEDTQLRRGRHVEFK